MKTTSSTRASRVVKLVGDVHALLDAIVALEINEDDDASSDTSVSGFKDSTEIPVEPTPAQSIPNPRASLQRKGSPYPSFRFGGRVLILSAGKHYHKPAAVTDIHGEQFWWVRTDDGDCFYKKYSSL